MPALRHRPLDLRLRHTFRLSRGATDERRNLLLELEADGVVGLGEAAPIPRYGQDRDSSARAAERMAAALDDVRAFDAGLARVAEADEAAAVAALDMALRDLAGKRLGAPLRELLGLAAGPMPPTSFTIGIESPEVAVERVREAGAFEVLKVKLGSPDDRAMLEAIRSVTDQRIRVDANEGWSLEEAKANLGWLAALGVELVEQPLPADRIGETAELRRASPIPLVADESLHRAEDVPKLAGAFDAINVKLMKCGGIGEALRLIAVARAHGMGVMLGCMVESSLGITAAAQVAPLVDWVDLDGHLLLAEDPFEGVRLENGRLVLPDGPGLGVRPREGV